MTILQLHFQTPSLSFFFFFPPTQEDKTKNKMVNTVQYNEEEGVYFWVQI